MPYLFRSRLRALALLALACVGESGVVFATDLYLTNRQNSATVALDSAGNWAPNAVPGIGDTVWLTNKAFTQNYVLSGDLVTANAYVDSLYGKSGDTSLYRTNALAGWTWTVTNTFAVGSFAGSTNILVLASGTMAVTNGNRTASLTVGQAAAGQGGLTLAGGTLMVDTLVATNSPNGSPLLMDKGTIEIRNGSSVLQTNSTTYTIGSAGLVNLTFSGGTNSFRLARGSGGLFTKLTQAVVGVVGPSTVWSNFTAVNLQGSGNRVTVSNGATAVFAHNTATALRIGTYDGNSNNLVLVEGAGSTLLVPSATLYVGQLGTGNSLVVSNGGQVHLGVALEVGASNLVVLTGAGSFLSNAQGYISRGADAQMLIADGAVARFSAALQPGYMPGSNQLVRVSGGATLIGTLLLGSRQNGGEGLVVVEDGGIVEANGITLGFSGTSAPTNGWGVITNRGGVFRFTAANPSVTINTNNAGGSANTIVVTNGTVEFAGVSSAAVAGEITKFVYQGVNTLALNGATNAALESYAVSSGHSFATLDLRGAASLFQSTNLLIGAGGSLVGMGTIQSLVVSNAGTIGPGHSPGTLAFSSNLTLLDASLVVLELNGTNALDHDRLVVAGTLARAGTLSITNLGWTFAAGDAFDLFDFGAWSGGFSFTNLPTLSGGLQWDFANFETQGILAVSSLPIPEPSVLSAVAGGVALLLLRRRPA